MDSETLRLFLAELEADDDTVQDFACSTCGRTNLPPAGDWDPPICVECDAEINFAAIEEPELLGDQ